MDRCMSNPVMKSEFPEQETRVAVCLSIWRDSDKSAQDLVKEGLK